MMGNPISGKLSSFDPVLTSGHVFAMLHSLLWHLLTGSYLRLNTVLGKGCVGGGGLDKQHKAIKASPTISCVLHSSPYGIFHIRKPVNKESVSSDHMESK
jgi:hypothetical protein